MTFRFAIDPVLSHAVFCLVVATGGICPSRASDLSPLPPTSAPEQSIEKPAAPPVTPKQVKHWVDQLDTNRFDARERSQRQLVQAGRPALEPVAEAARTGSLEAATRAINVLLSWSESEESSLRLAALEVLAGLERYPRVSKRAEQLLIDAREQVALARLLQLGGDVTELGNLFNAPVPMLQVKIDFTWKGDEKDLELLKEIHHARVVSIYGTPLTNDQILQLGELEGLHKVELYGTNVTPKVISKLSERIPTVDVRSSALLGISGVAQNGVPSVDKVVPGSAAEKAGIQRGDTITKLNGEPLTDFTDLTQKIGAFEPGDSVELTILRGEQQLNRSVTFQKWSIASTAEASRGPTPADRNPQAPGKNELPPKQIYLERR